MRGFKLLINGKLVPGATTLDVIDPSTEEVLAEAPRADRAQLNEAIAAAKAAFASWSDKPLRERGALLVRLADALEVRQDEFARLLTLEQGKPLSEANWEISFTIRIIRHHATLDLPNKILKEDSTQKIVRQYTPLGVVAAIVPWNFPMLLLAIKVAPALLAGNTLIAKPAPTTPLTTLRFGEIVSEFLPAGVFNVIVDRNDLGDVLTSHADIAKVAFTGSTATGKKVMCSVAGTLKRLILELGGNDAAIVLDDVDPVEVAPKLFVAAMMNAGQICLGAKRLYVHESQYDQICEELARLARETIVDDGLKPGTQMGPLQNKAQFEKVKGYIDDARRNGKIVAGGEVLDRRGYFIQPTIVRDISDDARLVTEEQFGPIVPVLRYSDINDAVARANNSEYGLGGTVWAKDLDRAFEVAAKIDTGIVWINKFLDVSLDVSFGAAKQSGIGTEFGQEGLEAFTQAKIINMAK
ncbi:aldehyde dehydrogenase family protein [Bradyrhizobium barranii]|uniref:Aldehyde dehydrogenase family protein n=1 Tax=Bradyrhizobium barranii TaxID=2992140 RepID=A0ABY3QIN6_9BRAD|nr:aldehyde dehydrogenase family protein [Bradyrhizobium japonicum]UFW85062.1 aldehyde dehydrogenase family protein [Bradyrhizobium japonicum]